MRPNSSSGPLLPGEAGQSDLPEDAQHWVTVYEELAGSLLTIEGTDPDQVGRLVSRLQYWRRRRDELASRSRRGAHAPASNDGQ